MLRLTKIELAGFKSFALATAIETEGELLGVVGPNGAGKSNVLDAIHFVFGEQKPTVLRVGRLADLIFGGAKTHPAQNLARVQLTLEYIGDGGEAAPAESAPELIPLPEEDETAAYASLPYGSEMGEFAETSAEEPAYEDELAALFLDRLQPGDVVTLARKVYRDGLSEYSLNGRPVRLGTVDRFLARYQLGRFAAFSINQGEVEKKLLAGPREIREWLGEASGVALLLRAKDNVARKLGRAQRNLIRVRDILHTLREDVHDLKEQAEDTRRHCYLEQQRRWLAGYLLRGRLLAAAAKLERLRRERGGLAGRLEKLEEELAQQQRTQEEAERAAAELVIRQRSLADRLNALRDELSRRRIAQSVLEEKQRGLNLRRREDEARLNSVRQRLAELAQAAAEMRQQTGKSAQLVAETENMLRKAEELLLREENSVTWLKDELAAVEKRAGSLERELAVVREKQAHTEQERTQVEQRLAVLERERKVHSSELARLQTDRSQLSLDFEEKEERLASEERRLAELRRRHDETYARLREAERELAAVNERASYLAAMKNTYEELKADFYLRQEAAAPGLALALTLTPLLDLISFEEEWSDAMELALGEVAKAFVLADGKSEVIIGEQSLHGIFIAPETAPETPVQTQWESLWNRLHGERRVISSLRSALGEVAVVASGEEAITLLHQHAALSGCLVRPALTLVTRGVIRKPAAPEGALLFRRHAELPHVDEEIVGLAAKRERAEAEVRALEQQCERYAAEIAHWDRAVRNLQALSADLRSRLSQAESRQEGVSGEQEKLAAQQRSLLALQTELVARGETLRSDADRLGAELEKAAAESVRLAESLRGNEERLAQHRGRIRELEQARMKLAAEHELAEAEHRRLQREETGLLADRERLEVSLAQTAGELAEAARELEGLAADASAVQQELSQLEAEAEGFAARQQELAQLRERAYAEAQALTEMRRKLEASSGDFQERLWQAEGELAEVFREIHGSLGISMLTMMHELAGDILRPAVQPADFFPCFGAEQRPAVEAPARSEYELLDYRRLTEKRIEEELSRVQRALANLGEVNPLAPREFTEKNERLQFLLKQEQDLQLAITDLSGMLEQLERQTRDRFAASLKRIEGKFNELFVRLFGSGFARFRLTDPADLLETGVEIEVQLPNARRQNLKALSGGERALLFIALFIAVHMVRPGSFCVLDEVDASLDDVNVARFCRLLQDLALREQFLVITHNKRTMRVMQRLVGVVTQPRGISRVIEVTLKQAEGYADRGAA